MPAYFDFDPLINNTYQFLENQNLNDRAHKPREYDGINYCITDNKDGKYSWRPFQLINPVLHCSLVKKKTDEDNWETIRKRFDQFSENTKIKCCSLPVQSVSTQKDKAEQILNWWHEIELRSVELAIDYEYLFETDITDCYGSIYTHAIAWALHGKKMCKANKQKKELIGNQIDWCIQDMNNGQTNGIPQGSVLMDF